MIKLDLSEASDADLRRLAALVEDDVETKRREAIAEYLRRLNEKVEILMEKLNAR